MVVGGHTHTKDTLRLKIMIKMTVTERVCTYTFFDMQSLKCICFFRITNTLNVKTHEPIGYHNLLRLQLL